MATFNINIQPIPPAWYTENFYMFTHDGCDSNITQEFTVGTLQGGENMAETWIFSDIEVLKRYSNKYLKITNMYSSHPDTYYMTYNGVKIPNGGFEPDEPQVVIDIELVNPGRIIPGLKFVFSDHNPDDGGNISFQVSMEDTNGIEGLWVYPRFNSQNLVCEPPPQPQEIFQVVSGATACATTATYRVEVPTGSSRYVQITPSDSFGTAAFEEEITVTTDYDIVILGQTGNYTTFSDVKLSTRLYQSSTTIIDSVQIARPHEGIICA